MPGQSRHNLGQFPTFDDKTKKMRIMFPTSIYFYHFFTRNSLHFDVVPLIKWGKPVDSSQKVGHLWGNHDENYQKK